MLYIVMGLTGLAGIFYGLWENARSETLRIQLHQAEQGLAQTQADAAAWVKRYNSTVSDYQGRIAALEKELDALSTPAALRARLAGLFPSAAPTAAGAGGVPPVAAAPAPAGGAKPV